MAMEVLSAPLRLSLPQSTETQSRTTSSQSKTSKAQTKIKMLEQGRKKLTSIETQRVISVLDETIKKLELVSMFQHAVDNLEQYKIVLGSELVGALREHQRLQDNMNLQLTRLHSKEGEEEYSIVEDKNTKEQSDVIFARIRQGIQSSIRNTLRLFVSNPPASKALRAEGHLRDPAYQELIQTMSEMRGFLFEFLLTSPLEQTEKMRYLHDITIRNKKNRELLLTLEEELKTVVLDRDTEISKKNEIIRHLKVNLHQLEKLSESQVKRIMQEAETQQKSDCRTSEGKCSKIHHELQQLRSQLSSTISENREIELTMRKKKYKIETEIENWIQKYDTDMGEKQDELEELEAEYNLEKAQLAEVQEKLAVMEEEYIQIMEERRLAKLRMEEEERELANKNRAATVIQAHWKGYLVRQSMKSKKKKKKGKGKGKKGKK
ncbi:IQ domain-containing protein D [Xenopus tropicalis]|uniref:Dynein regulatory complex protein 10 n=2 Tax=Xenopus tropicalis TaxID=8364 RepID=A0A8J0QEP0_XENTR|nr:dynein regulatory complex protein 10 [Xenopus tropicalis]|eukprot:NP_001135698.2 IQ domain-containing protein D [Xenopus tropicalis]